MSNNRSRKNQKRSKRRSADATRRPGTNVHDLRPPSPVPEEFRGPRYDRGSLDDAFERFPYWLYGTGTAPTFDDARGLADLFLRTGELIGYSVADPLNWTLLDTMALIDALNNTEDVLTAGVAVSNIEFLDFVWETGIYRGTEQSYIDAADRLGPAIDRLFAAAVAADAAGPQRSDHADPDEIDGPVFDPAAMGLFDEIAKVLAAVGTGTRVTSTRVLPPAVANKLSDDLGITDKAAFRSMRDNDQLMQLWLAAVEAELIEVNSTRAELTDAGRQWLQSGAPAESALRALICFVIALTRGDSSDSRMGAFYAAVDDAVTQVLVDGTTNHPQPVEVETNNFFLAGRVQQRLTRLVMLGLLDISGGAFVVPPVIASIVAKAIEIATTTTVFTVRADLQDMETPVWRTLELPSGLSLPAVHEILQTAFGWNRTHLHEFDSGTMRYLPPYADELLEAPGTAIDERAVLEDLFTAIGDEAEYQYDFGDGWAVTLTLKAVAPGIRPLPCVSAGSGLGPVDDCGGPPGWAETVAAVNDSSHERHSELRRWLGMRPGTRIDPTAFDVDATNSQIAEMFM